MFGSNTILLLNAVKCSLLFELVLQQRVEGNKVQHGLCYSNDLLLFIVFLCANIVSFQTIRNFELLLLRFSFVRFLTHFATVLTNAFRLFDFY